MVLKGDAQRDWESLAGCQGIENRRGKGKVMVNQFSFRKTNSEICYMVFDLLHVLASMLCILPEM